MRVAKPDEVALSLNGSPLFVGATAGRGRGRKAGQKPAEIDVVPFQLRDGSTLMIPAKSPALGDVQVELDEHEKQRLMGLRSQIEKMLNIRKND
jgi:hypothetical protein